MKKKLRIKTQPAAIPIFKDIDQWVRCHHQVERTREKHLAAVKWLNENGNLILYQNGNGQSWWACSLSIWLALQYVTITSAKQKRYTLVNMAEIVNEGNYDKK